MPASSANPMHKSNLSRKMRLAWVTLAGGALASMVAAAQFKQGIAQEVTRQFRLREAQQSPLNDQLETVLQSAQRCNTALSNLLAYSVTTNQ
jgi:hypothetical protein